MIDTLQIQYDTVHKNRRKAVANDVISECYTYLANETVGKISSKYFVKADSIRKCYRYWDIDHYRKSRVKDVVKVQLCHDLFCINCQRRIAMKRQDKYEDILDTLRTTHDIYHVTFTVKDPYNYDLCATLDKMYSKFAYVIQYFQCKRKAKGFDFSRYGFVGAVRSLEITSTYTREGIKWHPHFHCFFVLNKKLKFDGANINSYSFDVGNTKVKRVFTDFEMLLQKMWYLLYEGEPFVKENFDKLKEGYSCIVDKLSKSKYHEVFKYVLKGTFKNDKFDHTYETFKILNEALTRRKIIQGYGVLNKFKFEEFIPNDELYESFIQELQLIESPEFQISNVDEVLSELKDGDIRYISRSSMRDDRLLARRNAVRSDEDEYEDVETSEPEYKQGVIEEIKDLPMRRF